MKIKEIDAKAILDSRKEKTIFVSIKTNAGIFSASAPNGKSKGKFEAKPYKKSLNEDIKKVKQLGEYFSKEEFEKFENLRIIEDVADGHIGANTLFALESAVLKAIAKEQNPKNFPWENFGATKSKKEWEDFVGKQVWMIINPKAKKFPRFVGNAVGGGKHSKLISGKKPDFQEFLLIPESNSPEISFEKNISSKEEIEKILKKSDEKFNNTKNDENAWQTSLNEKEVLDILSNLKNSKFFNSFSKAEDVKIPIGVDIASSSFFKRKKYNYENPFLKREPDEQMSYLSNLIKNYNLIYVEDPFNEEDFLNFSRLLKKFPNVLIVGDDLTATNHKRFLNAIEKKSINAIIVKPNQNGSLLSVKQICETARENNIKIVFSHRSGETEENILADLAFGFQADFFKCGIDGKEREMKLRRMVEIEENLR